MSRKGSIAAPAAFLAVLFLAVSPSPALGSQGWQETDRGWTYYGEDGKPVEEQWIKDGEDGWRYAGRGGRMAAEEDGWLEINGNKYRFDSEGNLLTGWQEIGSSVYYLDESRGALTGWQHLSLNTDSDGSYLHDQIESQESGWFWFDGNGRCYRKAAPKRIDGRYYYFDKNGMMLYGWVCAGTESNALEEDTKEGFDAIWQYVYCGAPEDGSRKSGWVYTSQPERVDDSGEECYYYLDKGTPLSVFKNDGSGELRESGIIQVDPLADEESGEGFLYRTYLEGKHYAFNHRGEMQEGLFPAYDIEGNLIGSYYFEKNGGQMLLGKNGGIEESGDDGFTYYFKESGRDKGLGITGVRGNTLYYLGKRQEAENVDYRVVSLPDDITSPRSTGSSAYLVNKKGVVQKKTGKPYETDNLGKVILFKSMGKYSLYPYLDSKDEKDYENEAPYIADMADCADYLEALREPEW